MDTKFKQPIITDDLVNYLDSLFKDQSPDVTSSDRQVWYDAGAVSVVRHLKHLKARQDANILKKE